MKSFLFSLFIALVTLSAFSQKTKPVAKDSLVVNTSIKRMPPNKYEQRIQTEEEIAKKLNNIVAAYMNKPNTQATWAQIRNDAESMLFGYFKSGLLLGTKPQEAYFVKMGMETMTSTDTANHKMILQAGAAIYRPTEFQIITVQKTNTAR